MGINIGNSEIDEIYIGNTSIDEVYIGSTKVRPYNFATQGPAPDGFHVPTAEEYDTITKMIGWGTSSTSSDKPYLLKLPPVPGYLTNSGYLTNVNSYGYYWTCEKLNNTDKFRAKGLWIRTRGGFLNEGTNKNVKRAFGCNIRAFKNIPVIPTESWTILYGTSIEEGGVFWDESNGLISVSNDGSNWITIMDKNLGATTVYNGGDEYTEYNCGLFYQWGNNYGFHRSGPENTSTEQVDASSYGPGNYYDSNIHINPGSSSGRDSSNNTNLRGGEDGNVPV